MGATTVPLGKIYTDAIERFHEFQSAQDIPLQQRMVDHPAHRLPPPPAQYKANSDGVIFQDTGTAGIGVVIRDSEGMVIAALSERINPQWRTWKLWLAGKLSLSPLSSDYKM